MSDWHDDDFDEEWHQPPPVAREPAGREGVRVVGAPDDPYADPHADPYAPQAAPPAAPGRFALPGDDASWASSDQGQAQPGYGQPGYEQPGYEQAGYERPAYDQPSGTVQLPHWADPPTGEVPRVLGGDTSDADFDAWAQAGAAGPRFRTGEADWAEGDWAGGDMFQDETMGVGAHREDEEAWAPPPSRRGRRGRGRGRGRGSEDSMEQPHVSAPGMPPGPGMAPPAGLEGPPPPHEQYHDEYAQEEPEGGAPADLIQRVATAAVVGAVALVAFAAGRTPVMLLVTAIVVLSALELYTAFQRAGYHPATAIGLLGCLAIVPVVYSSGIGERGFPVVMILVVAFTFLWYLIEVVRARPTVNVGLTLIPFAWVGIFGAYAGLLLAPDPGGTGLLMGVVICAVGSDIFAYFVGKAMGHTPLLPQVSPNKTVEGLVAGAIAAVVLGGIVGAMLHPWADKGIGAGIVLGILVAIAAPLGDLVESMIKRDLGVKDLGGFLPGHGGFLDRFDAVLFALPLAFYWALHLFSV
jgi:phosphatidate cytidylyltransferase